MAQREGEKQAKKKAKEQARLQALKAKQAEDDGDGDENADAATPPEGEGDADDKESVEEPIKVDIEGDSDDDFQPIEIKDKVKAFIKEKGPKTRIPSDIINEAVRWRLNQNDCQNRGYVLDGYPKNFLNADQVFVVTPKAPEKKKLEEGEEEEPPAEEDAAAALKPTLQKNIYPESVISLQATD